jgi:hypothetical protein
LLLCSNYVIDRNATRGVPQMSAILLHQGQAEEIAETPAPLRVHAFSAVQIRQ